MKVIKSLSLIALALTMVACSSGKVVKTYEGDALPSNALATLTAGENLVLISVNDKPVPEYLLSNIEVNYGLKPGKNKVVFQYESVWARARVGEDGERSELVLSKQREVDIDAKPGAKLSFRYPEADNVREARALAASFDAEVVNKAGKVVARSHDVTKVQADEMPASLTASAGAVSDAPVAGPALPASEAIRVLWGKMTREEQKQFLQWAFQ